MQVELKLFASLRKYQSKGDRTRIDLKETLTVGQLLQKKGVPLEEAPLVLVNGVRVDHDYQLRDGDAVSVFPLIGGG